MKRRIPIFLLLVALIAAGIYYHVLRSPSGLVLTGVVTTDEVIVSSEIQGRLQQLNVREGDPVTNGELLAVIQPEAQLADMNYYARNEEQASAQIAQAKADLENAQLAFQREKNLFAQNTASQQEYDQARTAYDSAKARVDAMDRQTQAAGAQKEKAAVLLSYTEIKAPVTGIVDTRAALQGEVVNPGQAIVTLINEDDLWIRADVEETYIERIHLGDKLMVRLPSGEVRQGTVFFRGVDADYATQRDVSRTKRDIKTFEIRLRCDNHDRSLAVGMTAYVTLSVKNP